MCILEAVHIEIQDYYGKIKHDILSFQNLLHDIKSMCILKACLARRYIQQPGGRSR